MANPDRMLGLDRGPAVNPFDPSHRLIMGGVPDPYRELVVEVAGREPVAVPNAMDQYEGLWEKTKEVITRKLKEIGKPVTDIQEWQRFEEDLGLKSIHLQDVVSKMKVMWRGEVGHKVVLPKRLTRSVREVGQVIHIFNLAEQRDEEVSETYFAGRLEVINGEVGAKRQQMLAEAQRTGVQVSEDKLPKFMDVAKLEPISFAATAAA